MITPGDVAKRCTDAGLADQAAIQVVNAVAAFDSDELRLRAVDALIDAYHQSYPGGST